MTRSRMLLCFRSNNPKTLTLVIVAQNARPKQVTFMLFFEMGRICKEVEVKELLYVSDACKE